MNNDEFWKLIDSVHADSEGDMDRKCELLKERLAKLSNEEVLDFARLFDEAEVRAYTWPLWGAAYVMHGGCSDDSFSDFRATLISHGRKTYEAALADPESLVSLDFEDEDDICYEGFQYVVFEVADEKEIRIPVKKKSFPNEPSGKAWDEGDVYDLYPRLSAKYEQ
jgi:hypothetical protein